MASDCSLTSNTSISRATTLGDEQGNNSAMYFTGEHYSESRIRNLGKRKQSDQVCERASQRAAWVNHLQHHKYETPTAETIRAIQHWSTTTQFTLEELECRISQYTSSKQNKRKKTNYTQPAQPLCKCWATQNAHKPISTQTSSINQQFFR